jgi:sodium-dependent dicarboxylate transporter 2/3/5
MSAAVSRNTLIFSGGILLFLVFLLIGGGESTFYNALALGALMIYFWVFEVIPIYVTALFPLVFAIPLGILTKDDLAAAYGDNNVYLFFGGFLLALGLEKWKVHEQIAHGIISVVGKSKSRILFGFLMSTGFLSMWISNTATALLMLPMALGVIQSLPKEEQNSKFSLLLLLSVAFASSIGGVGTLIGSPPNTQMASILEKNYGITVDFFTWFKIGFPLAITMLLCTFLFFYFSLGEERMDQRAHFHFPKKEWSKQQKTVAMIFATVIVLWICKDFFSMLGITYRDENVALLGGLSLFLIPGDEKKKLLDWKDTEKLPWGILLLFGGGLALASMLEKNGIIEVISTLFERLNGVDYAVLLITVIITAVFASEVLSNLAMVSIFVPVIAGFAQLMDIPITQLAIPLTLGASLAFMLPVGTPPNAIVFSSGMLHVNQMVRYGFVLNIIGIVLMFVFSMLIL